MMKNIHWKFVWILVISGILSGVAYYFRPQITEGLVYFFTLDWIPFALTAASALVAFTHKMKFRTVSINSEMSFEQFRKPVEELFSFAMNPLTIVCSMSLIKGVFLYSVGKGGFLEFNGTEITFITIVASYLLYASLAKFFKDFKAVVLKQKNVSVTPEASDKYGNALHGLGDLEIHERNELEALIQELKGHFSKNGEPVPREWYVGVTSSKEKGADGHIKIKETYLLNNHFPHLDLWIEKETSCEKVARILEQLLTKQYGFENNGIVIPKSESISEPATVVYLFRINKK